MARIYFTYGAVPELAPLPRAERREIIRESGRRFGKTPQFMRVWTLGLLISFIIPIILALIVYLRSRNDSLALWCFVGPGLVGYTAWFHIRTSCLRPHIRALLSSDTHKT
jgi:hypothetical protein